MGGGSEFRVSFDMLKGDGSGREVFFFYKFIMGGGV